jgi:hypothetical protein
VNRLEELALIPYEDFDFEIIQDPQLDTIFKRTVVNEIWALFRTLWRAYLKTGLEVSVKFDPKWDYNQHGGGIAGDQFSADYKFVIDDQGSWTASAQVKFNAPENPYGPWYNPDNNEVLNYNIDLNWVGTGQWN